MMLNSNIGATVRIYGRLPAVVLKMNFPTGYWYGLAGSIAGYTPITPR